MSTGLTSPSAERVANYLAEHSDTVILTISKALHLGRSTVTKALAALEGAGQAERTKGERKGNRVEPDTWRAVSSSTTPEPPAITPDVDVTDAEERPSEDQADSEQPPDEKPDPPQTKTATRVRSQQRLRKGELHEAVAAYFREHTAIEVTAGDVARVLDRSAGAAHNAIQKLITTGSVTQTSATPRRYKATESN